MYDKNLLEISPKVLIGIIVVLVGIWVFISFGRKDDPGTGVNPQTITSGIESAGADIASARKEQRDAADGIGRAEIRAENLEKQIDSSRDLITQCRESVNRSQRTIRDLLETNDSRE